MVKHLEDGVCFQGWTIQHVNALVVDCGFYNHGGDSNFVIDKRMPWLRAGAPCHIVESSDYNSTRDGWVCAVCDKRFPRKHQLSNHLQSQRCDISYPDVFKCPRCPDQFKRLSALMRHVETSRCPLYADRGIPGFLRQLEWGLEKTQELDGGSMT